MFEINEYKAVRENGAGFFRFPSRGIIEVSGAEAVMFLNGLITNDVAKLESYHWMAAAFPNAQGRLQALARVLRLGDKYLFDTEAATYEKVLQNLSRFTLAGDFKVKDMTADFSCVSVRGKNISNFKYKIPSENEIVEAKFIDENGFIIRAFRAEGFDVFVPKTQSENFTNELKNLGAIPISEETLEVLRVENGEPKYNVDMDETTVVLETGLDEAVSFNKGCYIGQEIIARIHFRGHVAKQLTGLILEENAEIELGDKLQSSEGRDAGRITSARFSPALGKFIALAYVRYDYLAEGIQLKVVHGESKYAAMVKNLPFVD